MEEIKRRFCDRVEAKYLCGQREHGGNLFEKANLPLLLEEVLDFVVYGFTLEDQIKEAITFLDGADEDDKAAQAAKNVLLHGNRQGKKVEGD